MKQSAIKATSFSFKFVLCLCVITDKATNVVVIYIIKMCLLWTDSLRPSVCVSCTWKITHSTRRRCRKFFKVKSHPNMKGCEKKHTHTQTVLFVPFRLISAFISVSIQDISPFTHISNELCQYCLNNHCVLFFLCFLFAAGRFFLRMSKHICVCVAYWNIRWFVYTQPHTHVIFYHTTAYQNWIH